MVNIKKRAQIAMWIGIISIIVVIIILSLLSKFNLLSSIERRAESTVRQQNMVDIDTTSNTFSLKTLKGISIEELMGDFNCYGAETYDYGDGIVFDFYTELRQSLDEIYGVNQWALFIEGQIIQKRGKGVFVFDDSGSMQDDLKFVSGIAKAISPNSCITKMGDYTNHEFTCCYQRNNCGPGGDRDETWASSVKYLCDNNVIPMFEEGNCNPLKIGGVQQFEPWPEDVVRAIFFSSDEYSCSENEAGPDESITYVRDAIASCNAAEIKTYYIHPNTIGGGDKPMEQQAMFLAEQTDGYTIYTDNAEQLASELMSILGVTQGNTFVTSETVQEQIGDLPPNTEIYSKDFIYPTPCAPPKIGKSTLYFWY